jgi:hypothetical protein
MPLAIVTPVLAAGFLPMFVPETSPSTTQASADSWAKAYVAYVVAGGMPAATAKKSALASSLATAFNPNLAGGGPVLFMQALATFWIGMPVPAQLATAILFAPLSPNVNSPQPANATPQQQANGLAQVIAGLTLGAVKVQLTAPPFTILPLL